jgi:hypothetical protein
MRAAHANHTLLYIVRFLTGLNDSFAVVKSQILLMDPLPPMNKVFSMVLQHESQFVPSTIDNSKILPNAAKSRCSYNSKSSSRVCTFCGRDNHTVENCFKKHGLPPHLRKASSSNAASIEGGIGDSIAATSSPMLTQDQASQLIFLLQNSFLATNTNDASSNKVGSVEFTSHTSVNQGNVSKFFNTCSLGN